MKTAAWHGVASETYDVCSIVCHTKVSVSTVRGRRGVACSSRINGCQYGHVVSVSHGVYKITMVPIPDSWDKIVNCTCSLLLTVISLLYNLLTRRALCLDRHRRVNLLQESVLSRYGLFPSGPPL